MPLFNKKSNKLNSAPTPTAVGHQLPHYDNNNVKSNGSNGGGHSPAGGLPMEKKLPNISPQENIKNQLVFHCQLAHGSPTGLISGFSSVKELYQKIAECYDFPIDEVCFYIIFFQTSSLT